MENARRRSVFSAPQPKAPLASHESHFPAQVEARERLRLPPFSSQCPGARGFIRREAQTGRRAAQTPLHLTLQRRAPARFRQRSNTRAAHE